MSLLRPLLRPVAKPLRRALDGSIPPLARLLSGTTNAALYRITPGYVYEDTALATPASLNGAVGSVRDLWPYKNHLTQATAAAKPILRGTPTGSELVTNSSIADATGWTASISGVTFTGGTAVIADVASIDGYIAQQLTGLTNGAVYQVIVTTTANTTTTAAGFTLKQGSAANGSEYSSTNQLAAAFVGTWRFHITAGSTSPWITLVTSEADKSVTVTSVSVKLHNALSDVQAPYWLEPDGVDDFLSCSFAQSAYPLTLAAAARTSISIQGGTLSLAENDTSYKAIGKATSAIRWTATDRKESQLLENKDGGAIATPVVLVGDFRTATIELFVGGATDGATANTNTFGTHSLLYLGKTRVTGTFHIGDIYGGAVLNKMLTTAERNQLEAYLSGLAGVTL